MFKLIVEDLIYKNFFYEEVLKKYKGILVEDTTSFRSDILIDKWDEIVRFNNRRIIP